MQDEPRKVLNSKNLRTVSIGLTSSIAISDRGELYGWGNGLVDFDSDKNRQFLEPTKLPFPFIVKSVSLGHRHGALILDDGGVMTWGKKGEPSQALLIP